MKTKSVIYSLIFTLTLILKPFSLPVLSQIYDESTSENIDEIKTRGLSPLPEEPLPESTPETNLNPRRLLKPLKLPPRQPSFKPQSEGSTILPTIPEYTLATGDTIDINVFNVAGQGGNFPVFMDGTVSIPLIGNFKVEGMTLKEVQALFLAEYSRYLKRPIVTVTLTAQRPLQVAIAGEVNTPGNYNIPSNPAAQPTITKLFADAGGLTVSADISKIKLRRKENEREKIYVLNFWDLLREGDLSKDVPLQDGDVIIVPTKTEVNSDENRELADASFGIKYKDSPNITLVGEVGRPGSYTVGLEGGEPRLSNAIKKGGGIGELADIRRIQVRRTNRDGSKQIIDVDLWNMLQTGDLGEDILLQDGDKVIIPVARDIDPTEATALASANFAPDAILVNIIGPLRGPGGKKLPPNSSLNQAIFASGGFDDRRADQSVVELVRMNPNGTVTKREIQVDLSANINEETNPILKNNDVILVDRNGLTQFTEGIETLLGPIGRTFSFLNFYNSFGNLFSN